ncbi:hypothetical protein [Streptomyces sp. NRRL WC-3774]|uniref:Uncharacterized protein n=1 Tax=Streptomyces pseudovenezuelae TaxID=67350 RepID=A0A101N0D8_9ACTN|nr:hypothetical protein [Streptomyces sp. NRRL WC-3774]KUM84206.1 hypothetical protein AQI94_32485 [Streptomyces pseudovenezuelae]
MVSQYLVGGLRGLDEVLGPPWAMGGVGGVEDQQVAEHGVPVVDEGEEIAVAFGGVVAGRHEHGSWKLRPMGTAYCPTTLCSWKS